MADNRLYIGNKETGEYIYLSKTFSTRWREVDELRRLNKILETDFALGSTNLVIFSELDDEWYNYFMKDIDKEIK